MRTMSMRAYSTIRRKVALICPLSETVRVDGRLLVFVASKFHRNPR